MSEWLGHVPKAGEAADRDGVRIEEVGVPDGEQAQKRGQITLEGRGAKVLVDLVETFEHLLEVLRSDGQHGGETYGRIH